MSIAFFYIKMKDDHNGQYAKPAGPFASAPKRWARAVKDRDASDDGTGLFDATYLLLDVNVSDSGQVSIDVGLLPG